VHRQVHIRTAVWTEAGELVTFGYGVYGQLGHGGVENKLMPRLVEGLIGEQVVGASVGEDYTAVWTDEGQLFTFGSGFDGKSVPH
jgi:alpha-tubulin suppressor-like RCC1 family protein